jgi:hypothetical protein
MRMTRFALAAGVALALLPIASPVPARADSVPKLNVSQSCKAAARGAISIGRDQEACMGDERAAEESLTKNWSQYSAVHKTQCVGMTTQGGPSYVELISCLEIMRDAALINKSDAFGDAAIEKARRTPSNPRASRGLR